MIRYTDPCQGQHGRCQIRETDKLFTNRTYTIANCPDVLKGKTFIRWTIDRDEAVCTKAGVVFVATPQPNRNPDSVTEALLAQGFKKAKVKEFMLFGDIVGNICSVYQKEMKEGQKIELGKWGVIVF